MKILSIKSLEIPEIKIIRFARFKDHRGYFTEHFRASDLLDNKELSSLKNQTFVQANHSHSKKNVIRGLHFQWNPFMGKLVRTLKGHMVDIVVDIRKESPTYGKVIAYDMPADEEREYDEWIWVPPGFAHGNYFKEDSAIEYFCTGEYNGSCEAGLSPYSDDLDWSLCDENLRKEFNNLKEKFIISEKDEKAMSFKEWDEDKRSDNFKYPDLKNKELC